MELYPCLKPLKLIKPKEDREARPINGMIKRSTYERQAFGKMFKKEKAR